MLPTWVSDDLLTLLGRLTPRQRQAVVRIVEAELAGVPLRALLEGPNRICTKTTYYRTSPRPGWHHQARFREALAMARRDAAGHRLATALEEAIEELTLAAPEAARELRRQVRGDLAAVQALASAADEDVVLRQVLTRPRERVRCARCGRVLWDAKSIRLGMGPECRKK